MTNHPPTTGNSSPVLVLGVGGTGVNRITAVKGALEPACRVLVADTDLHVIRAAADTVEALLIGESVSHGHSTGQLTELGRRAVESERVVLLHQLQEVRILVMVAGLGGGTGGGALPALARLAKGMGISTLALVTLPFDFEGEERMKLARQSLDQLKHAADAVAVLPNQRLVDATAEELETKAAFALSDETLAAGLGALARLLTVRGLVNIDFGTLRSMLRHCGGYCWFSAAVQKENEPLDLFVSRLVKAPQFDQGEALRNSHGALLGITAGPELSFKTLQELVRQVGDWLPADILLRWGITLEEAADTPLSALLLTAKSEATPEPEETTTAQESKRTTRTDAGSKQQTELPFIAAAEGFFHKAEPSLYQGQDLDRPTYLRRGIRLP